MHHILYFSPLACANLNCDEVTSSYFYTLVFMSFLYGKISSLSGQEAAHTVMATLAKHFAGVAILSSPWQEQLSLISTVTPDVYCHQYAALLLKGRKHIRTPFYLYLTKMKTTTLLEYVTELRCV